MKKSDFTLFRQCNNYIKNYVQPIKKKIIKYVSGNQGTSQLDIFASIGEHQSRVSKACKALLTIKVLRLEKHGDDKRNNAYYFEEGGYEKLKSLHDTPGLVTALKHLIPPTKEKLLLFLHESKPGSVSECADHLGISKIYATTLLTEMYTDGLLTRATNGTHAEYRVDKRRFAEITKTVFNNKNLYKKYP